jgi:hypothetical protein
MTPCSWYCMYYCIYCICKYRIQTLDMLDTVHSTVLYSTNCRCPHHPPLYYWPTKLQVYSTVVGWATTTRSRWLCRRCQMVCSGPADRSRGSNALSKKCAGAGGVGSTPWPYKMVRRLVWSLALFESCWFCVAVCGMPYASSRATKRARATLTNMAWLSFCFVCLSWMPL